MVCVDLTIQFISLKTLHPDKSFGLRESFGVYVNGEYAGKLTKKNKDKFWTIQLKNSDTVLRRRSLKSAIAEVLSEVIERSNMLDWNVTTYSTNVKEKFGKNRKK